MTSRTRKFSLGVKIASILTCVALTAVGFAAWLIIKPADPGTAEGSFTVYAVEENNVTITVAAKAGSNSTIVWGKPSAAITNTNPWLVAGADVTTENLSCTFTVTVTSTNAESAAMNLDDILSTINVDFKFEDATNYSAALAGGYVSAPTIKIKEQTAKSWTSNSASDTIAPDADVTEMSFDVVVTFAWGANGNPYKYFNDTVEGGASEANIAAATAYLEAIEDLASDKYILTVTTTAKS